jgi:hypothetical protein
MRIPSFTAEISLEMSSGHYRSLETSHPVVSVRGVGPQSNGGGGYLDRLCRRCMISCTMQHTMNWCLTHFNAQKGWTAGAAQRPTPGYPQTGPKAYHVARKDVASRYGFRVGDATLR